MATYQPVCMTTINQTTELPETKRKLVDAGVKLMRRQGFNATTVDDICSAAGVTKGGFFHYFKSKEDIAKAAVVRFREGKRQDFDNAPFRKLADPLDARLWAAGFCQGIFGRRQASDEGLSHRHVRAGIVLHQSRTAQRLPGIICAHGQGF